MITLTRIAVLTLALGLASAALCVRIEAQSASTDAKQDTATKPSAAPTKQEVDFDALYEFGRQLFDDYAPDQIKEQYEFVTRAQWDAFFAQFQETIETGSMEQIAALQPKATRTLAALRLKPEMANYADWLAERLDLIESAQEALAYREQQPKKGPALKAPDTPIRSPLNNAPLFSVQLPPSNTKAVNTPYGFPAILPPVTSAQPFFRTPPEYDVVPYYNIWLRRVTNRSKPKNADTLSPLLKIIFAGENLPTELVWLAEIESSFNPQAQSPAGACGLFQLMPNTARALGLSLFPVDERTHPGKNARAAAKLLAKLYKRFGNWPLTLAAYNAGETRISLALKKTPGAKTYADIAQILPTETRLYVPQVLATVVIRENVPIEKFVPNAKPSAPPTIVFPSPLASAR